MRVFNALLVFVWISLPSSAQLRQEGRFEIPLVEEDNTGYKVACTGETGLLLYKSYYGENVDQLEIIRLDTAFQKKWEGFLTVEKGYRPFAAAVRDRRCIFLLRKADNPLADFALLDVDLDSGKFVERFIRNAIPFTPASFMAVSGAVFISGYFNYRPLVLHYSFKTSQARVLPGFFYEQGEVTQMKDVGNGTVDIVVSARFFDKKKSLWVRSYNYEGELNKTIILQADPDHHLLFGRTVTMADGSQLASGVYGRNIEYARGVFIARIDPTGTYAIRYYNFAELQHFFRFMKARREERVKKRIERRKVKGKKNRFNYRLLVDELIEVNGEIVMLGEAFYPRYVYASSGINTLPVTSFYGPNALVFDGFHYTHAVAIGFTQDGKIKWDNSFEINDVRTYDLEQFVKVIPRQDYMALLYVYENEIRTKTIVESQLLEGKTKIPLRPLLSADQVMDKSTVRSTLERWHGDTFYSSGVQRIRNMTDPGVPSERKVFFINKVVYK